MVFSPAQCQLLSIGRICLPPPVSQISGDQLACIPPPLLSQGLAVQLPIIEGTHQTSLPACPCSSTTHPLWCKDPLGFTTHDLLTVSGGCCVHYYILRSSRMVYHSAPLQSSGSPRSIHLTFHHRFLWIIVDRFPLYLPDDGQIPSRKVLALTSCTRVLPLMIDLWRGFHG